jgi:hypothetical protein
MKIASAVNKITFRRSPVLVPLVNSSSAPGIRNSLIGDLFRFISTINQKGTESIIYPKLSENRIAARLDFSVLSYSKAAGLKLIPQLSINH